jgi:hypothetical protein
MEKSSKVPEPLAEGGAGRKDRACRHVVRGSVLSRSLIQALERLGENVRTLRRIEVELRATLKPKGALGRLLFDRFWASVLRLIFVARLEEGGLTLHEVEARVSNATPSLREGALPILVLPGDGNGSKDNPGKTFDLDSDVFRKLALIARYDRSASREMYRTMSLLLIMRSEGETGLENWVRATAGVKNVVGEESKGG